MDDSDIMRALRQDVSVGTEAFRDDLLRRCLAVLGEDAEPVELSDEQLDMLAAAGDLWKDPDLPEFPPIP